MKGDGHPRAANVTDKSPAYVWDAPTKTINPLTLNH